MESFKWDQLLELLPDDPLDCARWASQRGEFSFELDFVCIDDGQIILHRDKALRRVGGTESAAGTNDLASFKRLVALQDGFTLDNKAMHDRLNDKKIFGAGSDAVTTCRAGFRVDYG